ncbi:hypothetical protein Cf24236_0660 [Citrobacter farmeri]|nr:hypothetical protein Cf24236_0660 [Citrobacter farmeri]
MPYTHQIGTREGKVRSKVRTLSALFSAFFVRQEW